MKDDFFLHFPDLRLSCEWRVVSFPFNSVKCMLWVERKERKRSQVDLPLINNALFLLPWEQRFLALHQTKIIWREMMAYGVRG